MASGKLLGMREDGDQRGDEEAPAPPTSKHRNVWLTKNYANLFPCK